MGDDIRPIDDILMETQSRRRRSAEAVSASLESCIISSGASSWCVPTTGRGTSRGEMLVGDLLFDIKADMSSEEEIHPGKVKIFAMSSWDDAYKGAVDDSIKDTHLQRGLKRHPFAQVWKG